MPSQDPSASGQNSSFDHFLRWACDSFVVLFGVWSVLSQALLLWGGTFVLLRRLAILVPVLSTVILIILGRRWKRPNPGQSQAESAAGTEPVLRPHLFGLAGAALLACFYVVSRQYLIFWAVSCLFLGFFCLGTLKAPLVRPASLPPLKARALLVFILLAGLAVFMTLFVHRPDSDDSFYISQALQVQEHPQSPLLRQAFLLGVTEKSNLTFTHRLSTYNILIGLISDLLGIKPMAVAHLLLPALFALVFICAAARLLRLLVGPAWLYGLAALVLILAANGDMHMSYGNFAFVRFFHGKSVVVTVLVPALAAYGLEFISGLRPGVWALLALGQAAALGFSINGLFVGPLTAGLALASGWRPEGRRTARLAWGLAASFFPLALGLWARFSWKPGTTRLTAVPGLFQDPSFEMGLVLGLRLFMALWLLALLGSWALMTDRPRRRWMLGYSFLFLVIFLNPFLIGLWKRNLTSAITFWRILWIVPLPAFLAVLLSGPPRTWLASLRPVGRWAAFVATLLIFALAVPVRWTFSPANRAWIAWPGLKVPAEEYRLAEQLAVLTPRGGMVLAPEAIAAWITTIPRHPLPVVAREMYMNQMIIHLDRAECLRRLVLFHYVNGTSQDLPGPQLEELFRSSLAELPIRSVAVSRVNRWRSEIEALLRKNGFRKKNVSSSKYLVYISAGERPGA